MKSRLCEFVKSGRKPLESWRKKIPKTRTSPFWKKIRHRICTHLCPNIAFFCTRNQPRVKSRFGYIEINRNYVPPHGHVVNFSVSCTFLSNAARKLHWQNFLLKSGLQLEAKGKCQCDDVIGLQWRKEFDLRAMDKNVQTELLRKLDSIFLSKRQYRTYPL